MTGLFGRGCLKRVKQIDLPMSTRVISSRFHYKIKLHYAGEHKLRGSTSRTEDGKIEDRELNNRLWVWVDSEFAADLDTRRSHTGYVIMMNGGPINWKSVKQKSESLNTTESEWYAAREAGKELLYLRIIMREFGFSQLGPMYLYEDSRACK
jgi:hypothetical protein